MCHFTRSAREKVSSGTSCNSRLRPSVPHPSLLSKQTAVMFVRPAQAASVLSFLVLASAMFPSALAACKCNISPGRPAAAAPPFTIDSPALSNVAQDIASAALTLLEGSKDAPHKLAMVFVVLYDAYAATRDSVHPVCDDCMPSYIIFSASTPGEKASFIAHAAYLTLAMILSTEPDKILLLHARMRVRGFSPDVTESHISKAFVDAVLQKYMLREPTVGFRPRNPPSRKFDAECDRINVPDEWQGQCVQRAPGEPCTPQEVTVAPYLNASLISFGGERKIGQLIKNVPAPPMFKKPLSELPFRFGENEFAHQYLQTLKASAKIDDERKWVTEFFRLTAALRASHLALNEAVARNLSLGDTAALMVTVSGAARDAFASAVEIKLRYATIRPVTVLQCAYRGRPMRAWNAPYHGVRKFINGKDGELWRPYLQTTAIPGYVSGTAAVAGACAQVLNLFFKNKRPVSANCAVQEAGMSEIEPRIEKGSFGYIAGITDVPNQGAGSVGYAPADDVSICWKSFGDFADIQAKSREYGGIHIPADNYEGLKLGKRVGGITYRFVMHNYNNDR